MQYLKASHSQAHLRAQSGDSPFARKVLDEIPLVTHLCKLEPRAQQDNQDKVLGRQAKLESCCQASLGACIWIRRLMTCSMSAGDMDKGESEEGLISKLHVPHTLPYLLQLSRARSV